MHKSEDVEFVITNMLISFKSKLLEMPNKVLPEIMNLPDDKEKTHKILEILNTAVKEALNELSEYNPNMFNQEIYLADDEKEERHG